MALPSRAEALGLLKEYTKNPGLIKHGLAAEAAMRALARRYGGDEDLWGLTGLLHDFDYERWPEPENHPTKGAEILRGRGYPEEMIYAILSHANYLQHLYPRKSPMDRALFSCEELAGFIMAVALVRPNKSLFEVDVRAVKKKLKDKRFAAGVSREDVVNGAAELGVDLDEHIGFLITALQSIAGELELDGRAAAGDA